MNTLKQFIGKFALILFLAFLPSIVGAQGGGPPTIQSVQPSSASAGDTVTLTVTLQGEMLPPSDAIPESITVGTIQGSNIGWNGSSATVTFTIPASESAGTKDVTVQFPTPPDQQNSLVITKTGGFEVLSGSSAETGSLKVTLSPQDTIDAGAQWKVDGGAWQSSGVTVSDLSVGSHTVSFSSVTGWNKPSDKSVSIAKDQTASVTGTYTEQTTGILTYPIVDTGQENCYSDSSQITCPSSGQSFYGQDAQYSGNQPSYTLSSDGLTVYDNVTGLTWTKSPDLEDDGDIDVDDKLTFDEAQNYPDTLNTQNFGGYSDWRLPTMKELYSLMNFTGTDPSGPTTTDATPFIDTGYFDFAYGDESAGERNIDAQFWSNNAYVGKVFVDKDAAFGLNLADGRIKGYGLDAMQGSKVNFVYFVRGNTSYGINNFTDNKDGTITDNATGLMWSQDDSGDGVNTGPRSGMTWEEALAWVEQKNADNYLGHSDWRLPNAKEMQSILNYERAPATGSAAIDPIFNITQISNEGGETDYPWFWTGTTHVKANGMGDNGVYICFGRAMGYMNDSWMDVHGAGAQRSDQKGGSFDNYTFADNGYYMGGECSQCDATRIYNYARLVRDAEIVSDETGSLTVTLSPADAVTAGAQWQVDSGSWQSSGTTVSGLSTGIHTVSFKSIDGWTAPASQSVSITANQTKTVTGTYTQTTQQTGSLKVTISPQEAINDGAQWQVNGGSWQNSGAVVPDLAVGTHSVKFKTINGWTAPSNQTVTISAGVTKAVSGTYTMDKTYTLSDAIRILQILCGITHQEGYEDVNGDNKAGLEDVVYILQSLVLQPFSVIHHLNSK